MKITFDSCVAEFGDISVGEAFLYDGHFYLKVFKKDDLDDIQFFTEKLAECRRLLSLYLA